ncbi:DUF4198 domain-containing protein [Silicimonas algicola]|nr:DUF4198 domain-containing protein [Silicimonas algicola]
MRSVLVLFLCMACIASLANAHEFWIDPVEPVVPEGGEVVASLRVGQAYEGSSYAYVPPNFRRFDYVWQGETRPVEGVIGDRPAATVAVEGEGLMVLIHVTTDTFLTWDTFEMFESFVRHKDAEWTLAEHEARGISHEKVREVYSRYAKALVAVGSGEGADAEAGLLTELVALENPYTGGAEDGLRVRLLYQGAPRGDAQIEVFEKDAAGVVTVSTVRTDAAGEAVVPAVPGRSYMLDAVVLREPAADIAAAKNVSWESLWANLTFYFPE